MNFNYDKIKGKVAGGEGGQWASYADLSFILAFVFLLLFMMASLRSSTVSVLKQRDLSKSQKENTELKEKLALYDSIGQKRQEQSESEKKIYKEVLSRIDALKSESQLKKEKLQAEMGDVLEKEKSLDRYQELVKHLVTAKLVASNKLSERKEEVAEKNQQLKTKSQEIVDLEKNRKKDRESFESQNQDLTKNIAALQKQFDEKLKKKDHDFKQEMQQVQSSAEEKLKKEQAHAQSIAQEKNKFRQEKAKLEAKLAQEREESKNKQKELSRNLASLGDTNKTLKDDLQKAIQAINQKKELAKKITDNFKKAGIGAQIDPKTGDVVIDFGQDYFESDSASLKSGMKAKLRKLMPEYAKSLMEDPVLASKIENVEIIGFASPTYQSKFVDPRSLRAEQKKALNYNLDLSYKRARTIFDYSFDTKKMAFEFQKELFPLVKVSGRGYLANNTGAARKLFKNGRTPSNDEFCAVYECNKAQTVLIKFNLRNE